jgi:hypothetical protein
MLFRNKMGDYIPSFSPNYTNTHCSAPGQEYIALMHIIFRNMVTYASERRLHTMPIYQPLPYTTADRLVEYRGPEKGGWPSSRERSTNSACKSTCFDLRDQVHKAKQTVARGRRPSVETAVNSYAQESGQSGSPVLCDGLAKDAMISLSLTAGAPESFPLAMTGLRCRCSALLDRLLNLNRGQILVAVPVS